MAYLLDMLPSAREAEAAAILGQALVNRKGKGLPGRRQYEEIEVVSRFSVPLRTVSWYHTEQGCRSLVVDPQGLLAGTVRFGLTAAQPDLELSDDLSEEGFHSLCQQLTKKAVDINTRSLEIAGLVMPVDQILPLFKEVESDVPGAELEQPVDADEVVSQLRQELERYAESAAAWQQALAAIYARRDQLTSQIEQAAQETRDGSSKALEDLKVEVDAAIATKAQEIEAALAKSKDEFADKRQLLSSELERFQQGFKDNGDDYWRDQIKSTEQKIAELDRNQKQAAKDLEQNLEQFRKQQQERLEKFKAERDKRLAALEQRSKRLDTTVAGLKNGVEKRLELLAAQPDVVSALAVELAQERCASELLVEFCAVRYPGNRWQVFAPQVLTEPGLAGKLRGLVGGVNLPFKPATKLGETLAGKLEKQIFGEFAARLEAHNLLNPDYVALARTGIRQLVDQGKADKKALKIYDEYEPQ
ncbi:MAG: hypothetical protein FH749_06650 [Firmicutes bacterium]|nr:hypothetical protein [Bacillota bacterium]